MGGRPSERLMMRLGTPVSDTTILRSLKGHARFRSANDAVRVAGVDDWAWRKGANYGTIIVDLERRRVVDLLADRSAETTAGWLKDHPEVEVVSRDRAGLYAEAARQGAPQARQVADRFHLVQNFRETVERQLGLFEAPIPKSQVKERGGQPSRPLHRHVKRHASGPPFAVLGVESWLSNFLSMSKSIAPSRPGAARRPARGGCRPSRAKPR